MTNTNVEMSADSDSSVGSLGMDSFAALFEQSVEGGDFAREGEIISGTVVKVNRDTVVVDIGGKSEGIIALQRVRWSLRGKRRLRPATRSTSTSRAVRTMTAL